MCRRVGWCGPQTSSFVCRPRGQARPRTRSPPLRPLEPNRPLEHTRTTADVHRILYKRPRGLEHATTPGRPQQRSEPSLNAPHSEFASLVSLDTFGSPVISPGVRSWHHGRAVAGAARAATPPASCAAPKKQQGLLPTTPRRIITPTSQVASSAPASARADADASVPAPQKVFERATPPPAAAAAAARSLISPPWRRRCASSCATTR
jgi:hypothetical protein